MLLLKRLESLPHTYALTFTYHLNNREWIQETVLKTLGQSTRQNVLHHGRSSSSGKNAACWAREQHKKTRIPQGLQWELRLDLKWLCANHFVVLERVGRESRLVDIKRISLPERN